ncbi:MAG: hypothetical protein K2H93_09580 [Oscillospiraceae bacterium]|nr:hypothetical protein [Oscillospiraceae bacterium]MDE6777138.1 hypothetical protein [Oscillospiraceae bacterium]
MGTGNYKILVLSHNDMPVLEYHFENVYIEKENGCIQVLDKKGKMLLLISAKRNTVVVELEENLSI